MKQPEKFTFRFYFQVITKLLREPRKFYGKLPVDIGLKRSLGVLLVSSVIFSGASLVSRMPPNPMLWGGVFFINALGMAVIAAGIGFMVMIMTMGKQVTFTRFFSIYALSAGITLLASWIPFFIWITEPWKWWLIGTGMTRGFGFRRTQAGLIIGVSIGCIVLFFWSVLPLVSLKGV